MDSQPQNSQPPSQALSASASQATQIPEGYYRYEGTVGFREWTLPTNITDLSFIGCGSYGTVCKANMVDEEDEIEEIVVKKLINPFESVKHAEKSLREIKYLVALRESLYVVEIISAFTDTDLTRTSDFENVYFVTTYCGHSMNSILNSRGGLHIDHIRYVTYQTLCGLKYIHSAGIVHRDLKPGNICIDNNYSTKIIDFGLARSIFSNDNSAQTADVHKDMTNAPTEYVQTRSYRAPELVLFFVDTYGYSIDIWSLGLIIIEMMIGEPVFKCHTPQQHVQELCTILGRIPYYQSLDQNTKDFFEGADNDGALVRLATQGESNMLNSLNHSYSKAERNMIPIDASTPAEVVKRQFFQVIMSMVTMDIQRPLAKEILKYDWFASLVPQGYDHEKDDVCEEPLKEVIPSNQPVSYYKEQIREFFED